MLEIIAEIALVLSAIFFISLLIHMMILMPNNYFRQRHRYSSNEDLKRVHDFLINQSPEQEKTPKYRRFNHFTLSAFICAAGLLFNFLVFCEMNGLLAALFSIMTGLIAMLGAERYYRFAKTNDYYVDKAQNSLGNTAVIRFTIPPKRSGMGDIDALVERRRLRFFAVTDSDEPLKHGTKVRIESATDDFTVCVTPLNKQKKQNAERTKAFSRMS